MKKIIPFFVSVISLTLMSCGGAEEQESTPPVTKEEPKSDVPVTEINDGFKRYFDSLNLVGTFAMFNAMENKMTIYNKEMFYSEYCPASTFKIFNSLVGLETGAIPDENFTMKWDGKKRWVDSWNQDHDLKSAFRNSVVWYYQELAKRVGEADMQKWIDKVGYGNRDISGGIDQFWLDGGLRITPSQQITFVMKLRGHLLPFSQRSMDIVERIMIEEDTLGYVLRAKTGWAKRTEENTGWYVGYVERDSNVVYFVSCIQGDTLNPHFVKARKSIAMEILRDEGVLPK